MVWQNIFSGWKNLLRTECCMCFSEWLLSLSFWKHEGNFLRYSLWEPGRTPRDKKVLGSPLRLICPAVFNSQTCPQWASSKFDNYILIFYTLILVSTEVSVSWASMVSCVSLFSSLYLNFGSNALSCDGLKKRSFFKFVQLFFFFFWFEYGNHSFQILCWNVIDWFWYAKSTLHFWAKFFPWYMLMDCLLIPCWGFYL